MNSSRPGPHRSLTVWGIATAAIELADDGGLDAVTMRSVAFSVGTSAPALYRYVASRGELLGYMVDAVSATLPHPEPTGDWLDDLLPVADQLVALHRAHPWLATAWAAATVLGPHTMDHLEWGIAVFRPLGAPAHRVMEAIAVTNGVAALFATVGPASGPEAFRYLDTHRHPGLAEFLAESTPTPATDDLLHLVLPGILTAVFNR